MEQPKLYQLNIINETLGGNIKMIETMLQIFVQSISETVSVLKEAVSQKNIIMSEKALHKCRPSIFMICEKTIQELFTEIESFQTQHTKDGNEVQDRFFESITLFCEQLILLSAQLKNEFPLDKK